MLTVSTIKNTTMSLRGDDLSIGALRELVRECDAAHVPDGAVVRFKSASGTTIVTIAWTANAADKIAVPA